MRKIVSYALGGILTLTALVPDADAGRFFGRFRRRADANRVYRSETPKYEKPAKTGGKSNKNYKSSGYLDDLFISPIEDLGFVLPEIFRSLKDQKADRTSRGLKDL